MAARRDYTDAEVEAAVQALSDPLGSSRPSASSKRTRRRCSASSTQALGEANWFDSAHQQQVLEAAGKADIEERLDAVHRLLAEETRVAMLIGVAVGFELAHELIDKEET